MRGAWRACALTLAVCAQGLPARAQIVDYPTLDRVLFVEQCIRDHPQRSRQEMLYKCACAIDALAAEIPYGSYTDLATASQAASIAGERGNTARGDDALRDARRYRTALAKAYETCLIAP